MISWKFLPVVLLISIHSADAQFEDVRCKCVCPDPSSKTVNVTVVTVPADECECEIVTHRNETECLKCECKFQSRNTLTIQVVVILVIVLIVGLLLYLLLLLIFDPSSLFKPPRNQRYQLLIQDTDPSEVIAGRPSILSRFGLAQRRWQTKVRKQREDIFENQTILS